MSKREWLKLTAYFLYWGAAAAIAHTIFSTDYAPWRDAINLLFTIHLVVRANEVLNK
jgi:hypothetical protein